MFEALRIWWESRGLPREQRDWWRAYNRLGRDRCLTDAERHAAEIMLIPARFFKNEAQRAILVREAQQGGCYCYQHGWNEWFIWMDDQRYALLPGGELHPI